MNTPDQQQCKPALWWPQDGYDRTWCVCGTLVAPGMPGVSIVRIREHPACQDQRAVVAWGTQPK